MKQRTGFLTWVGFIAILVWCLLPVAWIISLSFKSLQETTTGSPQFLPEDPTVANYQELWDWPGGAPAEGAAADFQKALINSIGISLIATVLSVILATLGGLTVSAVVVFFAHDAGKTVFWVFGLFLSALVGPAQAASRSFLARVTPAHTKYDGHNYYPTSRWVLFGHHFAAITGAGPLVGPTLAAQFGYAPSFIWLSPKQSTSQGGAARSTRLAAWRQSQGPDEERSRSRRAKNDSTRSISAAAPIRPAGRRDARRRCRRRRCRRPGWAAGWTVIGAASRPSHRPGPAETGRRPPASGGSAVRGTPAARTTGARCR